MITIMRRKSETSSYEGGGEVGYSVLDILSTAGGAECTLEIQESQSKLFEFLPNSAQPAKGGEACLPGVSGLMPICGMVGLEVQCASQGGHCCQWQAHSHPMREPRSVDWLHQN